MTPLTVSALRTSVAMAAALLVLAAVTVSGERRASADAATAPAGLGKATAAQLLSRLLPLQRLVAPHERMLLGVARSGGGPATDGRGPHLHPERPRLSLVLTRSGPRIERRSGPIGSPPDWMAPFDSPRGRFALSAFARGAWTGDVFAAGYWTGPTLEELVASAAHILEERREGTANRPPGSGVFFGALQANIADLGSAAGVYVHALTEGTRVSFNLAEAPRRHGELAYSMTVLDPLACLVRVAREPGEPRDHGRQADMVEDPLLGRAGGPELFFLVGSTWAGSSLKSHMLCGNMAPELVSAQRGTRAPSRSLVRAITEVVSPAPL